MVDPAYWEWPNAAVWTVDARGRILSPPEAPWSGANAPTTVDEALRTMGIEGVPDTALGPAVVVERSALLTDPIAVVPWLAGCAWMVGWLRRRRSLARNGC